MQYEIRCSRCKQLSSDLVAFKCPNCGQVLETKINLDFEPRKIQKKRSGHWRYIQFFPYIKENEIITLGEGWTPLVRFSNNITFKLESSNPTGSFKDRGSTNLISAIHNPIKNAKGHINEDSSGNAGASIAAYSARAGLKAKIYVPQSVSGPKFSQIQFYGAEVMKIPGPRNKVAEEAQKVGQNEFYVGHLYHPLFRDGIKSLAYEIAEQLHWRVPEQIYMPVSAGTLLLGVIQGLKHLLSSNVIDKMPRIVACQTRQVSPLYHRIKKLLYKPPETVASIADALASTNPPLLDLMARELMEISGDAVMVEENDILEAFKKLAKRGFFVEPSSAVAYAAYQKQLKTKETSERQRTVIILTGTGLKTTLQPN